MAAVIAVDLPGGRAFVDALRSVWEAGDAALPVDQRLPSAAKHQLLTALAPAAVIDGGCAPNVRPLPGDARPTADGDALVVATSGTTGHPKGVVLTHEAVAAHAHAVHQRLLVDPSTDRWLACLPLSHIGGLGVVTRALVTGTPLEVMAGFDAAAVTEAARRRHVTLVSLVPTALGRVRAGDFRTVVLGGSADWRARGDNVVHTYGLTESGGGVIYDMAPLDGVEVRLVDGEIFLRGPMLLRAYRDGTDPRDADGWLPTGDLGHLDATGRVVVEGRRAELIVTGGENVWPSSVEEALADHPKVGAVVVSGRADDEWGQKVVAFVVPMRASAPPTLAELRSHARRSIPAFAAPRALVLVESVPRTALGKIRRDIWREP